MGEVFKGNPVKSGNCPATVKGTKTSKGHWWGLRAAGKAGK
jgi:hypothetical protein